MPLPGPALRAWIWRGSKFGISWEFCQETAFLVVEKTSLGVLLIHSPMARNVEDWRPGVCASSVVGERFTAFGQKLSKAS